MIYQTKCVKIQLRPNSLERVREWAQALNDVRRSEALATLRDETVVFEAAFLDQTDEGDFLIYVMKAENFEKAKQAGVTSPHEIDKYHQEFKRDTWAARKPLELLVDLDRISELTRAAP